MFKDMTVYMWHPIDGIWVHLVQVYTDEGTFYYTNGKKVLENIYVK